ncbi:MAG: NfeD family protein [Lachnospiraceae bacterium]|nr:NfeD family protein [Lachnospiraceae bacterium]
MVIGTQAFYWLALLVVLLAIEAITLGLTTIWFAGGALVAFILATLQVDLMAQIAAFCAVSILLLIFTRPAAARWLNRDRVKTNAQSLVGETAIVTETINNLAATGQVQVHGQYWTARALDSSQVIEKEKNVTIEQISGVKLIVKALEAAQ